MSKQVQAGRLEDQQADRQRTRRTNREFDFENRKYARKAEDIEVRVDFFDICGERDEILLSVYVQKTLEESQRNLWR